MHLEFSQKVHKTFDEGFSWKQILFWVGIHPAKNQRKKWIDNFRKIAIFVIMKYVILKHAITHKTEP